MSNSDLLVGTVVRLNEDSCWIDDNYDDDSNPTHCSGVIVPEELGGWVTVSWDNGRKNNYRAQDEDLIFVK